ncbi:haloacid dehalogenase-like hydrolase family protein [Histomonas meleagridis]|uniref:haloacid dehalogenase-like hydrolase family protein n=1 Tax=Histomonas meleagridis TaxID=135588 RepID=UPI00355A53CB|nr:haloacid dehalogenase-like hydrolase family protein [Histomonas meleagridis]KAH0800528.1 haloacid dehalogenase-like hydrolase family protein [Histomonas meleagridis]
MNPPKVLLLDGDGVIWIDGTPIEGAINSLNRIRKLGIRLVLVTNNCSKTRSKYLSFMENMGLEGFTVDDIFSSGFATAKYLNSHNISKVFVSGFPGLMDELRLHDIEVHNIETDSDIIPVDAVVVSKSDTCTFEEIKRGMNIIKNYKCPLIGTNPDPNFPMPHNVLIPGSGSMVRTFETASHKGAIVIGKPEDPMFETVLTTLNVSKDDVMMVGDRIVTDIAFAAQHGARSVLVLSGVDTAEDAERAEERDKPTYVLKSLVEVADLLEEMTKK